MADAAGDWLIYIAGSSTIQGELMAVFLEKETGLPSRNLAGAGLFPERLQKGREGRRVIVFGDCKGRDLVEIVQKLENWQYTSAEGVFIVLFNVAGNLNAEEELLRLGVWGIFYEDDPPGTLCRGVDAVRNGEIWSSRQIMSSCLVNFRRHQNEVPAGCFRLSGREQEVLRMVADGFGNNAIADKLCVSVHTVRSHVYRIFKKIDVSNRQQAAIWAARNL